MPRFLRTSLPVALLALVGGLVMPSAALHGLDETATVVLSLVPRDAAGLDLAATSTRSARTPQAVDAAAPAPTARAAVLSWLSRHGFEVRSASDWTVTVRGPARRLARALGTTVSRRGGRVARQSALHVPAELRPYVSAAGGLRPSPKWRPRAVPIGHTSASLRAAYEHTRIYANGAGVTAATLQFSGWTRSDLRTYASAAGIPLAAGQITEIELPGADADAPDGAGGDFEVSLDQETLLAAAPKAKQRIYFSANSAEDAVAAYARIADEVLTHGIDVVSVSWGMCEPDMNADPAIRVAVETEIARIVANGATFFAPSGDLGAYDCSSESAPSSVRAVDFPAVSRYAVAVGGTRLTGVNGVWQETAWSDPTPGAFRGHASGGGYSATTPRPSYQASTGISSSRRMVPDVAAVAAPATGIGIYATYYKGWVLGGGTSASAPLWAGQLASALSGYHRTVGLGSIHDRLYAHAGVGFRDITSGNNFAYNAGPGYDLVTGLGAPRWDRLSAALVGAPILQAYRFQRSRVIPVIVTVPQGASFTKYAWGELSQVSCASAPMSSLRPGRITVASGADRQLWLRVVAWDAGGGCHVGDAQVVIDTRAPVTSGSLRLVTGTDGRTTLSWGASDPSPSSGVATHRVSLNTVPATTEAWRTTTGAAGQVTLSLRPGYTYVATQSATDRAGNTGPVTSAVRLTVPHDQGVFTNRTTGWNLHSDARAYFGGVYRSRTRGNSLERRVYGKTFSVLVTMGRGSGYVDAWIDGKPWKRIDTYSASTQYRVAVPIVSFPTAGEHSIRLIVAGRHRAGSIGDYVYVDGLIAAKA